MRSWRSTRPRSRLTRTFGARSAADRRVMCVNAALAVPYATKPAVAQQSPDGGRDVDDRPRAAREQMRSGGLAQHERGRHVEVERSLEEARARVEERTGHRGRPRCSRRCRAGRTPRTVLATIDSSTALSFTSRGMTSALQPRRARRRRPRRAVPSCVRRGRCSPPASANVRAIPAPNRGAAPVTIATLPSSRNASSALMRGTARSCRRSRRACRRPRVRS